jgi:hypothetical protein
MQSEINVKELTAFGENLIQWTMFDLDRKRKDGNT